MTNVRREWPTIRAAYVSDLNQSIWMDGAPFDGEILNGLDRANQAYMICASRFSIVANIADAGSGKRAVNVIVHCAESLSD
jgi:hypothetical protein